MRAFAFLGLFSVFSLSLSPRSSVDEQVLLVRCFGTVLSLPADAPQDVISMLVRYGSGEKYERGILTLNGEQSEVIFVGMPWGPSRPAVIIFHTAGKVERMYWADEEGEPTTAWDRRRGLRKLDPCSGGCLTTEICFPACTLGRDGVEDEKGEVEQ